MGLRGMMETLRELGIFDLGELGGRLGGVRKLI